MGERTCPNCGEPWPRLSLHVCEVEPDPDPEQLCALLWEAISSVPVSIGEISISPQIATVLTRPLARELVRRKDELLVAMEADDG